ncbi:hypothetical protein Lbir_0552 [Legionella birminghamensis]|uniref:Uncharacterized protein n=1 Tax=Legionella birminghamensis TaxID=28083 RepID=A0A378IBD4_9GAMM|nr:hypothetical protein [Legionella birminghamensis]KTC75178.1 hypothetical protein Lbir_0552 [Legionella birminghamensis]STX31871.1 Uncharacterised protein [Legionella birminghamensis]
MESISRREWLQGLKRKLERFICRVEKAEKSFCGYFPFSSASSLTIQQQFETWLKSGSFTDEQLETFFTQQLLSMMKKSRNPGWVDVCIMDWIKSILSQLCPKLLAQQILRHLQLSQLLVKNEADISCLNAIKNSFGLCDADFSHFKKSMVEIVNLYKDAGLSKPFIHRFNQAIEMIDQAVSLIPPDFNFTQKHRIIHSPLCKRDEKIELAEESELDIAVRA